MNNFLVLNQYRHMHGLFRTTMHCFRLLAHLSRLKAHRALGVLRSFTQHIYIKHIIWPISYGPYQWSLAKREVDGASSSARGCAAWRGGYQRASRSRVVSPIRDHRASPRQSSGLGPSQWPVDVPDLVWRKPVLVIAHLPLSGISGAIRLYAYERQQSLQSI